MGLYSKYSTVETQEISMDSEGILVADENGDISVSSVTEDQLTYLSSLSSNLQDSLDLTNGSAILVDSLTVGINSALSSFSTGDALAMDTEHNQASIVSVLSLTDNGAIYCPSGYYVELEGVLSAYNNSSGYYYTIYRVGYSTSDSSASVTAIGTKGCTAYAGTGSTSVSDGVSAVATMQTTADTYFWLKRVAGTGGAAHNGNVKTASTLLRATAYKIL